MNLFLNFLMSPDPVGTAVDAALEAAADGSIELLLPDDVVAELMATVARRTHLTARIRQSDIDALLARLSSFVIRIDLTEDPAPSVSRDPNDDYLLMIALLHAADYIVTRDNDLLDLGEVAGVRIVDPVTFLGVLRAFESCSGSLRPGVRATRPRRSPRRHPVGTQDKRPSR